METLPLVVPLPADSVAPDELNPLIADYLALDRAHAFRRLLVARFVVLAAAAAVVGAFVPGATTFARWFTAGLFLTPPVWAWTVELRLARQVAHRLRAAEDAKKVVKNP